MTPALESLLSRVLEDAENYAAGPNDSNEKRIKLLCSIIRKQDEALTNLGLIHFPSKAVAGVDIAEYFLTHNLKHAKQTQAEIEQLANEDKP